MELTGLQTMNLWIKQTKLQWQKKTYQQMMAIENLKILFILKFQNLHSWDISYSFTPQVKILQLFTTAVQNFMAQKYIAKKCAKVQTTTWVIKSRRKR